ncbi:MAG: DNA-binding protein WhiA [Clostridia bacterium]|nr:DNA-binding protein WhiA [Clostridia bacterium]
MSFTTDVKNQILSVKITDGNAQRAFVSAFLRTCGSVEIVGDKFGFSAVCDLSTAKTFSKIVRNRYGEEPTVTCTKGEKTVVTLVSKNGLNILSDLGILSFDGAEVNVNLSVGSVADGEECFKAYSMGAFLGSGSVTVPFVEDKKKKTGYHLEIVFSKYVTASDYCALSAEYGFMPKLVERKGQFVVYYKSVDEIGNFIALVGANSAYLKLAELQIKKEIRNDANRKVNCEVSNMTRTVNASVSQREDINKIAQVLGLDALKAPLKIVAEARLTFEDYSMQELADHLGITKSCLSHRLKKLSEIAKTL